LVADVSSDPDDQCPLKLQVGGKCICLQQVAISAIYWNSTPDDLIDIATYHGLNMVFFRVNQKKMGLSFHLG